MSRVVSRVQMATPGKGDYTHVVIEKSVNPPFPRELEAAVFDFFHVFKRTVKTMVMHPDTADKLRESEWHVPAARGRPPRFEYAITFATIVRDPHMSRNLIELRG